MTRAPVKAVRNMKSAVGSRNDVHLIVAMDLLGVHRLTGKILKSSVKPKSRKTVPEAKATTKISYWQALHRYQALS
jgi:hypothetical protein